ncbi:hypothetical protein AG0111_0g10262 [Alternaria gaisen]|uniref:Uncharacterized protein n=1 Tax=Alternaria gaisen TaxID=167740 RepID=A0ACB6F9Z0_9PLEO|nr:hypothetical protein AG0111_0g10262 [Alternaria gaisen]
MHIAIAILIAWPAFLTSAIPIAPRAALIGSPRNVYLTTCTTRSVTADTTLSSAILYSGSASTNNPTDIGTVSSPRAIQWAGFTRRVTLESGVFESRIAQSADTLPKSELAGSATLTGDGNLKEEFACFRDGTSTFRISAGVLGAETTVCVADFWCGSIAV